MLPKLLLVEDDRALKKLIKTALKKICEVDTAEDGETAIKLAGITKYPIILMDIALGYGLDGIETTKIIRNIPEYKNTPIVAVTAFAMVGDKEIFLSQGMTHYFPKRVNIIKLKNFIIEIFNEETNAEAILPDPYICFESTDIGVTTSFRKFYKFINVLEEVLAFCGVMTIKSIVVVYVL